MRCSGATWCAGIPLWVGNNLYCTAMSAIVTIDNFFPKWSRYKHILIPLHIDNIRNTFFLVKRIDDCFLDLSKVELKRIYERVVEMYLVVHQTPHDFVATEFFLKFGIQITLDLPRKQITTIALLVCIIHGVIGRSMIGGQEKGVVAFAHMFIEVSQKLCNILVKTKIGVLYLYRR